MRRTSVIVFPLLMMLIAIANPLINVLSSAKWAASIPYFQLLCLASLFNPIYSLIISALNARGRSRNTFTIEIIKKALIVISILICLKFGIIALLIGFCISNWLATLISVFAFKREINHFWMNQFKDIFPSLFIGIVIAGLTTLLSYLIQNLFILLSLQLLVSIAVYILMVRFILPELFNNAFQFLQQQVINRFHNQQNTL